MHALAPYAQLLCLEMIWTYRYKDEEGGPAPGGPCVPDEVASLLVVDGEEESESVGVGPVEVGREEVRELEGSAELVPPGEDDELEEESDMADVEGGRETHGRVGREGGVPSRRPTKQSSQCGA